MIHIFPYVNYEIKSLQKKEVILKRFCNSASLTNILTINQSKSYKDFDGILNNDGFKLRRIFKIGYSAFMPILSCKILKKDEYLSLKINIQFHKGVNAFLIIFFVFQLTFLFTALSLGAYLMFVFVYMICLYFYNSEAQILKEEFDKIIREVSN